MNEWMDMCVCWIASSITIRNFYKKSYFTTTDQMLYIYCIWSVVVKYDFLIEISDCDERCFSTVFCKSSSSECHNHWSTLFIVTHQKGSICDTHRLSVIEWIYKGVFESNLHGSVTIYICLPLLLAIVASFSEVLFWVYAMEPAFLSLLEALLNLTFRNCWWDGRQFFLSVRTSNFAIITLISFLGTRRNDMGPYKANKFGVVQQP